MPHNRFYYPHDLEPQTKITLLGDEHHHLYKVMRLQANEHVELIDGRGKLAFGTIENTNKEATTIAILDVTQEREKRRLILAQSMMRGQKMDLIVEKATELGVSEFIFYSSDTSEKSLLSENQLKRMHQILISASKQCGRLFLPQIEFVSHLDEVWKREAIFLYGDLFDAAPFCFSIKEKIAATEKALCILIGPEKGFSEEENTILKQKALGVRLSKNILRAETAAIASVCLLAPLVH